MSDLAAIVLAAGGGTRMHSSLPKVLHRLAGRPMIDHVLATLEQLGVTDLVVVTGAGADQVESILGGRVATVRQEPQRGTADAAAVGMQSISADARQVLVTMGDVPLLPAALLEGLAGAQAADQRTVVSLLSARMADPTGYGRVVRGADGSLLRIVEESDADAATRTIEEVNVGTYCFDAAWLRNNLGRVPVSASGELYLTDLVGIAVADGRGVAVVRAPDPEVALGVNDRVGLAVAERWLRRQIAERHMRGGVTIVDPDSTLIDIGVEIGLDVRIEPWTIVAGATVIGPGAVIGPHAQVHASRIGARSRVWSSVVEESSVDEEVQIGPFAHLRPGCQIGARSRIGNFAELKRASLGADAQVHHFGYLGDAVLGERVNIGAGAVTANFDGTTKHRTIIGDDAFIGVDTMLRAPITVGPGARTGAGAVVTRDVAPGSTVVGMPARPIELRRHRASGDDA